MIRPGLLRRSPAPEAISDDHTRRVPIAVYLQGPQHERIDPRNLKYRSSMEPLIHLPRPPKRRYSRGETARMFWRAAYYVRRQRLPDEYTGELLAYLEREFDAIWRHENAR